MVFMMNQELFRLQTIAYKAGESFRNGVVKSADAEPGQQRADTQNDRAKISLQIAA